MGRPVMWKHRVCRLGVPPCTVPPARAAFYSSKGPNITIPDSTKPLRSWESGAQVVKNTRIENQYLEIIRDTHDPSLHIKTIEDELKGTIGKALGKQGDKVNTFLRAMEKEKKSYLMLMEEEKRDSSDPLVVEVVKRYNAYRKEGIQARWELIVHRQAVGFTVREYATMLLFARQVIAQVDHGYIISSNLSGWQSRQHHEAIPYRRPTSHHRPIR